MLSGSRPLGPAWGVIWLWAEAFCYRVGWPRELLWE